jgi:integrase
MSRVYIIARYLDWRATCGGDPSPLTALCERYGRRLTPIVRALLENDYEKALDRLRPLPEYGSTLGPVIRDHVERMQSLGCRYDTKARDLKRFDRFLQIRADLAGAPLSALLEAWAHSAGGVRHRLRAQQCGRTLSQALRRHDATTAILSIDVGLQRRVLQEERKPHLFTEVEIQRIFDAARTYPSPNAPLRPIALYTMVTLAYCVGLRIGEIVSLTLGDLNLVDGLVEIRDSKFFKSRRLPLAPSVLTVLSRYLQMRAEADAPTSADAPLWWTPMRRQSYS